MPEKKGSASRYFSFPPGLSFGGQRPFPPGRFLHNHPAEFDVDKIQDKALQVAKEIVVKFIEVGRLTPSSFEETFDRVYKAVERTVRSK